MIMFLFFLGLISSGMFGYFTAMAQKYDKRVKAWDYSLKNEFGENFSVKWHEGFKKAMELTE